MAGRPLRRLQAQALVPFADWVPPKPRYVKPTAGGMASVAEAPHPAFRSKKHGIVVVWDGIDDYGDPVEYEPNAVAVREGGEYLFSGLQGLAAFHDEDSRKPYSVILPAGATYAEALSYILSALDKYPTAAQMPPALFEGLYKSKGSSYGRITMKWGMAPSQWLRPREQRKRRNPSDAELQTQWLATVKEIGPLYPGMTFVGTQVVQDHPDDRPSIRVIYKGSDRGAMSVSPKKQRAWFDALADAGFAMSAKLGWKVTFGVDSYRERR